MAIHIAALLDKAQVIHRLPSDYKLALVMGISHSSLTSYRQGKTLPDARVIAKLCDLTGDDPGILLAQIEAERAKTAEARALWLQVVERLQSTLHAAIFSVLIGGAFWGGFPSESQAAERSISQLKTLYIVECRTRSTAPTTKDKTPAAPVTRAHFPNAALSRASSGFPVFRHSTARASH